MEPNHCVIGRANVDPRNDALALPINLITWVPGEILGDNLISASRDSLFGDVSEEGHNRWSEECELYTCNTCDTSLRQVSERNEQNYVCNFLNIIVRSFDRQVLTQESMLSGKNSCWHDCSIFCSTRVTKCNLLIYEKAYFSVTSLSSPLG